MSAAEKLKHELKAVGSATLFFGVWIGGLILIKNLVLEEYQIETVALSKAVVGVLILAKVVLILALWGGWATWTVTMYDDKAQLLIEIPINRCRINSPMLPGVNRNADGLLTLFIRKNSPGKDKESNWLPAPSGPIHLVMRLYRPKTTPPSILPPVEGTWKPPGIVHRAASDRRSGFTRRHHQHRSKV